MATRRNSPYLTQTEPQIKEAAEAAGISLEDGKKILDHFFKTFRYFMHDDRMPTISIPVWGKITPTFGSIRRAIRASIRMYRQNRIPKRILEFRIRKFWPIRLRLAYELKHHSTFLFWYKIPRDWVSIYLKNELAATERYYFKGGKERWEKKQGIERRDKRNYGSKYDNYRPK
jgi:hypothetical protein